MARERSWFVGFTKKPACSTTATITSHSEKNAGSQEMAQLANQLSVGANIGGIDPETERDPPARALPIVLPKVTRTTTARWSNDHPPPDFQRLFASITRPDAPLTGHLRALNFDREICCQGDALLPPRDDNTPYGPPKTDIKAKFAERIAELDITNDAAFRALTKTTKPGDKAPRILYMRKFWMALENMAQYWDTTADQLYFTTVPTDPDKPGHDMFTKSVRRYKGRRTANGRDMPDKYRADTVNAFVEGVTAAFNCRVSTPHVPPGRFAPTMQVNKLEQPVRLTSVVMRLPTDRDRARTGFLEGPVMGVLERNTTDFVSSISLNLSWRKSEHDLLREIAAMLLLAQQRAREGKALPAQDQDKWYTSKPRWGGGPGGKIPGMQQCEDEYEAIVARIAESTPVSPEMKKEKFDAAKKLERARLAAKNWSTLKALPSLWHEKTDYMAIGKPPGSPYDEIFLVSCIYHHVSILKLSIHNAYTEYLTTGVVPAQTPVEEDWGSPKLERTVWYDLLSQEGRVDAFRCIWGVMEYVSQDVTVSKIGGVENGTDNGVQS